jgi:hypothetical protein
VADENHPVPKGRSNLIGGQWFPDVLSKIAPLEWWSYEESTSDAKRVNYLGDLSFKLVKSNTWEFPRFCFSLFRPSTQSFRDLVHAVAAYQGAVVWQVSRNRIGAWPAKPTFYAPTLSDEDAKRFEETLRNPPKADSVFVKRAVADIPALCAYLEKRLGLTEVAPADFDPVWLTREGLAQSRGEFEEFYEPGDQPVFLVPDPKNFSSSADRRRLPMSVRMFQTAEIFKELNPSWETTSSSTDADLVHFPFLSRLFDITNSALYEPDEIPSFMAELLRAQQVVREPASIRGLDNLIRIARLSQKQSVGIYFVVQ